MKIEEIKTRTDLNQYIDEVGAENLSDAEVSALQDLISTFTDKEIEELNGKDMDPRLHSALLLMKRSFANSAAYSISSASPERVSRRCDEIQEALNEARLKEARSYELTSERQLK